MNVIDSRSTERDAGGKPGSTFPHAALEPIGADAAFEDGQAFCATPWFNLSVAIGGGAQPCCLFAGYFGDVKRQSIQDIWHGQEFRDFRAKMIRDERDDRCSKCYEVEATGGPSLRKQFNAIRSHLTHQLRSGEDGVWQTADSLVPMLPTTLDIRFSNLCNFSCRMCSHGASSRWFSDARELGWAVGPDALINSFTSTEVAMQALRPLLATIERIYFAGGEPLLLEQHYAILQELIDHGRTDVALGYNSNMSELRLGRLDVLGLWSHFNDIYIEASVDGSGARGELIREGMSWTDFVANVTLIKQRCPHVRIHFGITVSVFNVWALPDLYRDLRALECAGEHDFHLHVLQDPDHYSIQILPRRSKLEVKRRLEAHFGTHSTNRAGDGLRHTACGPTGQSIQDQVQHVIDHMMADDRTELIETFRSVSSRLDAMRHESTIAVFPELAPLLRFSLFARLRNLLGVASRRAEKLKTWVAHT